MPESSYPREQLVVWLFVGIIRWFLSLSAAIVAVRMATALVAVRRPLEVAERRRRDARWAFGWLVMLAVGLSIVRCQAGGFYSFVDPHGGEWLFDGHGWPLTEQNGLFDRSGVRPTVNAIYWTAVTVDLALTLLILAATRIVVDHLLAAWGSPNRWSVLGKVVGGWCVALIAVLLAERLVSQPRLFPGTELIIYTTLLHEPTEIRVGMLVGLSAAVYLGVLATKGMLKTVNRWRDEGLL